jgi:hypothetical protein
MAPSQKEREVISSQLGRKPKGVLEVTNYSENGDPLVIKTNPIIVSEPQTPNPELYEPFPTLYYLTHPETVEAVSRLEDLGLIRKYELKIEEDDELRKEFLKAQKNYTKERIKVAGLRLFQLKENKRCVIEKTGIGGVKDLTKIKCLHAHYAHYLATGKNPIGKIVHEELTFDSKIQSTKHKVSGTKK